MDSYVYIHIYGDMVNGIHAVCITLMTHLRASV